MSLEDIVLFYSHNSKFCIPCLKFLYHNRLDLTPICVDNQNIRDIVIKGGKTFRIQHVPTLLISYTDGSTKLYVGTDKILAVFTAFLKQSAHSEHSERSEDIESTESEAPLPKKHKNRIEEIQEEPIALEEPSGEPLNNLLDTRAAEKGGMTNILSKAKQLEEERNKHDKELFGDKGNHNSINEQTSSQ